MDERWGFLRPWFAPLQWILHVNYDTHNCVPTNRVSGISVSLPISQRDATPAKLCAIRDALVLLAILARVDHGAWKYVLKEHCALDVDASRSYQQTDGVRQARFVADVMMDSDNEDWTAAMLKNLFSDTEAAARRHFTVAAKKILDSCAGCVADLVELEVPIAISLMSSANSQLRWESIQRVLRDLRHERNDWKFPVNLGLSWHNKTYPRCFVVLELLEVELFGGYLTPADNAAVLDMLRFGDALPLSRLTLLSKVQRTFEGDPARNAQIIGRLLEHVLCASGCPADKVPVMEAVELALELQEVAPIGRFCSALVEARTIDKLRIYLDSMDRFTDASAQVWAFMAYALFSRQAKQRSSITHVVLCEVQLTEEDADAMAAILGAADPVALLFGRSEDDVAELDKSASGATAGTTCSTTRWTLEKGTAVTLLQMHPGDVTPAESATWTLAATVSGVKVLPGSELGRARVVVPGYGVCEVDRSQLTPPSEGEQDFARWARGGVTSLELIELTSPHGGEGVYRFLELVGLR